MSYEEHILDAKIHKFLARKEREHPELRESADQLFIELISPHFSNHLRDDHHGSDTSRRGRQDNSGLGGRMSGLHYAA